MNRADAVINNVRARNIYPGMSGASIGIAGTSPSAWNNYQGFGADDSADDFDNEMQDMAKGEALHPVEAAAMIGASGNSVAWWLGLAAMLAILMFGAKKLGSDGEFSNIKMSVYNVLIISFASIIGISFFKMVFTKFPVPGLTSIVMSA